MTTAPTAHQDEDEEEEGEEEEEEEEEEPKGLSKPLLEKVRALAWLHAYIYISKWRFSDRDVKRLPVAEPALRLEVTLPWLANLITIQKCLHETIRV